MNTLHTLSKHATIAMMIAATGLPASLASAQFKVEHSAKAEKAPEAAQKNQTVSIITSHDDKSGHKYEIKIVNGVVEIAKIDDKKVDAKQIKVTGDLVLFLDESGKTLHEFKLPSPPSAPNAPKALWESKGNTFDFEIASASGQPAALPQIRIAQEPKVMLGINLSEPSKALRKHLKLADNAKVILVEKVIKGLPAASAGLEDFDVIVSIDGSDSADSEMLSKVLGEKNAGDQLKVVVLRAGDKVKLTVKLAAYDSEALSSGSNIFTTDFEFNEDGTNNFQFLTTDDMDNATKERLERNLVISSEHAEAAQLDAMKHREIAEVMRAKAKDAMRDVERQIIEFKDGKLVVRSSEDIEKTLQSLTGKLHENFPGMDADRLHTHMQEMDARLSELESRLDEQMDRMSSHMDRLSSMFERMMDRLESKLKD